MMLFLYIIHNKEVRDEVLILYIVIASNLNHGGFSYCVNVTSALNPKKMYWKQKNKKESWKEKNKKESWIQQTNKQQKKRSWIQQQQQQKIEIEL